MVRAVSSDAITMLLERARRTPARYREVLIASAFIDAVGLALALGVARRAPSLRIRLVVGQWLSITPPLAMPANLAVTVIPELHAKAYALLAKHRSEHALIVTSTNLTRAGLSKNVELGLQVTGDTPAHAMLIEQVANRFPPARRAMRV